MIADQTMGGIMQSYQHPEHVASVSWPPDFDVFDRSPDPALDELTELAAVLSLADYAYIAWPDVNRLWFKSRYGFNAAEQPRATSACNVVFATGQSLLITDAAQDVRFPQGGIELPGARPCRSYAGVPLISADQKIVGTLALLAHNPGQFQGEHLTLLDILGRQATTRLELYNRIRAQEHAQRARNRTERALAVERCFVAATLDSIPALVAVLDTAGRIVRFNQSCAQLTGMSLAEAAGRLFVDEVLEPEDREWAVGILRQAAAGQVSGPHETTWRVPGGSTRRVSWTLRPLQGPNGEIQYVIVSGQDVTDQRQAEEALLSSEARYRQVVEGSLGFVFTCTMEGRLTSLNAFTAETLGYRVEDLTGRSIAELLDSTGALTFQECLHALQTKDEWQGAIPVRRSDGVYRRIAFRSRRMELRGERPFILNHGVDVTEQHEAEEALHLATRQRELILQAVGDGIYGIDLDGRLTFINEAGARALGYQADQLTGRDVHEVIHHSHADGTPYSKVTSPILQGMRRRESVRMADEVFWRADGTSIPVEYSASPLIEDGRISGMVVAFQDITERRRLEKMKDEFISTVSHELRTPLTSLRAALGLISSGSLEKRPDKQKQMVDMAIANCDRLVRLVNDILDFDKVEKGHLPLRRVPVEAVDLLRRAAEVAYSAATEAGMAFRIEAVPAVVIADEDRILQVLNELVSNAIKFSPRNTQIKFSAQPLGDKEICLSVEDQGQGIPPEKLEHIFNRFQQGDASDSRPLGGTGLGLALCRSIIEQHDGRIWAESTLGRGSKFFFTLPAASAK
ncbi:PAS domain S-box protein [Occallatibacter riparius]|uniref:histidine kinase n=1 Tax=Occallatibacter riparius TaxID=1002689 RepID=A0A9J7BT86_9BACT|nr:PAS domain S-box protein [Occallatibacter riparius]UWZ84110.1 PAS domain S-box protein [Occallatibacter riparius]